MVVAFYFRLHLAYFPRPVVAIFARPEQQQQAEAPNGYVEVRFDGLEMFIYWSKGEYHVGARANGIHIVNPKP